jgi:hypothetical protein
MLTKFVQANVRKRVQIECAVWHLDVDTFDSATSGIIPLENQQAVSYRFWRAQPRSVVVFENRSSAPTDKST